MDESIFVFMHTTSFIKMCSSSDSKEDHISWRNKVPEDFTEIKQKRRQLDPPLKFQQPLLKVQHD